jgi:hypothetical protein
MPNRIQLSFIVLLAVLIFSGCKSRKETAAASKGFIRKKMLVGAEIQGIKITSLPRYSKDGEAWDAYAPFATEPDPYVVILWNESALYRSETLDNIAFGQMTEMVKNLPFRLSPFDQPLLLEVFDEDGISGDDNVGYVSFTPRDYHGQDILRLVQGDLSVELSMKWYYEE